MDEETLRLSRIYLQSNACGLWDGALKASTHSELCECVVTNRFKVDGLSLRNPHLYACVELVRKATRILTDNLDVHIGFPTERAPNYNKLTPLFAEMFLELAEAALDEYPQFMSDEQLDNLLKKVTQYTIGHVFTSLGSYDFEFVDGDHKKNYLVMKSSLGQVVRIQSNKFYGCSYNIEKKLN